MKGNDNLKLYSHTDRPTYLAQFKSTYYLHTLGYILFNKKTVEGSNVVENVPVQLNQKGQKGR